MFIIVWRKCNIINFNQSSVLSMVTLSLFSRSGFLQKKSYTIDKEVFSCLWWFEFIFVSCFKKKYFVYKIYIKKNIMGKFPQINLKQKLSDNEILNKNT